ncbi:MAG: hypothetical protein ACI4RV_04255, partial [Eubacteriales bacterium]
GNNNAITDIPAWCEDCGIELDFSNCTIFTYLMHESGIYHIGTIKTINVKNLYSIFGSANNLMIIDKIILKSDGSQEFNGNSFGAINLESITFEGVIGQNIWFSTCTKLTTTSLLSILTALSKDSALASGKTITLATAHKAKIESDAACTAQLNAAIAAGWTVAYV